MSDSTHLDATAPELNPATGYPPGYKPSCLLILVISAKDRHAYYEWFK